MRYTKEIIKMLKTNTQLRLKVCLALNVTEQTVHNAIKRQSKTLFNINAVNTIKEYTGLTEEEIFETETVEK